MDWHLRGRGGVRRAVLCVGDPPRTLPHAPPLPLRPRRHEPHEWTAERLDPAIEDVVVHRAGRGQALRRRPGGVRRAGHQREVSRTAPIPRSRPEFSPRSSAAQVQGRDRHVAGSLEREPLGARDRILHSRARLRTPRSARPALHPHALRSGARGGSPRRLLRSPARGPPRASHSVARDDLRTGAGSSMVQAGSGALRTARPLQHRQGAPAARPTYPRDPPRGARGPPPRGARGGSGRGCGESRPLRSGGRRGPPRSG